MNLSHTRISLDFNTVKERRRRLIIGSSKTFDNLKTYELRLSFFLMVGQCLDMKRSRLTFDTISTFFYFDKIKESYLINTNLHQIARVVFYLDT